MCECVYVCVCARACVCVCARVCVRVCVYRRGGGLTVKYYTYVCLHANMQHLISYPIFFYYPFDTLTMKEFYIHKFVHALLPLVEPKNHT